MYEEILERFRHQVERRTNGCWQWRGSASAEGFGRLKVGGKLDSPHRVAYEMAHGDLAADHWVSATCGNPSCINPAHLVAVARDERMKAAVLAGRCKTRLTPALVREIRWRFATEEVTKWDLAREYRVGYATIFDVVRGRSWGWIEEPGPIEQPDGSLNW